MKGFYSLGAGLAIGRHHYVIHISPGVVATLEKGFLKGEQMCFHGVDGKPTTCQETIVWKDFLTMGSMDLNDAVMPVCL
jgi:hypothetical protein